jgi:GTP-binding protein EngB required for normal cell division
MKRKRWQHIRKIDSDVHEGNEAYRAFMDKLTESNVDEYVNLPTIAVMGDTSSGKSSLLSMIAQVELPSNDKLTTRCPIMLQMHKTDVVSARVRVIWKDKPDGSNVDFSQRQVTEANWDNLTDYIAEAQAHIITKQNKEVARDIVSVEINGPNCENLTLIDLPGIVRSHGKGESETLSDDIQALLSDFLNNKRCVILAVLPANVDFHNSQIMAEAWKVDPETKRTIPVLTKPDLIDDGAEGSVKELLLGEKTNAFQMGFHMVKGRGQKALDSKTSIDQGLVQEASFFQNTEPWRNVENKLLFGTKNLRVKLGELQMNLIRSSFDDIVSEMKAQRNAAFEAKTKLGSIPSGLVEKRALFRSVKDEYYTTIGPLVMGGRIRDPSLTMKVKPSAQFHLLAKAFKDELTKSRLSTISDLAVGTRVIVCVDEMEVRDTICCMTDEHVYIPSFVKISSNRHKVTFPPGERAVFTTSAFPSSQVLCYLNDSGNVDELKPIASELVRRDPDWIGGLIEDNRPYKLPIFLNTEVFEDIVSDLISKDWSVPSLRLLDETAELMTVAADHYVQGIDSIGSLPRLRTFLSIKSSEIVEQLKGEAKTEILSFIERERTPYTQNHYLFENLSKLRSQRLLEEVLASVVGSGEIDRSAVETIVRNVFGRNQARSMDDHMAEEMQHALNPYGKVAVKRFIDAMPMIFIKIIQSFADKINCALCEVMDADIDHLVSAPHDRVRAMKDWERKIQTLDKGIAAIKNLSRLKEFSE